MEFPSTIPLAFSGREWFNLGGMGAISVAVRGVYFLRHRKQPEADVMAIM